MIKRIANWVALALLTTLLPGAAAADVKIGVAAPMSGDKIAMGKQFTEGVRQAVDDINEKGGLLGEKLVMVVGDDRGDPQTGVEVANQFSAGGVKFVVGHHNSSVSIAAAPIYAANGVLMITPGSTNPLLTELQLWNVVRVIGRDDQQGTYAADFIAAKFANKNIVVARDSSPYGKWISDAVEAELVRKKVSHVFEASLDTNTFDPARLAAQMGRAKVEVMYWAGMPEGLVRFLGQSKLPATLELLMGPDSLALPSFGKLAGVAADGLVMTFAGDPRVKPEAEAVNKEFAARDVVPVGYALYAYAAVQVIAGAAATAHSLDATAVATAIRSGQPFATVLGALRFDKKGDRTDLDYSLFKLKSFGSSSSFLPYSSD